MTNPLRATPHPHLLEIAVRPWLGRVAGPTRSLAAVPDAELRAIRARGFHGVWLMGAWPTGPTARRLALDHESLRAEYDRVLPGWAAQDVEGSPYSIADYRVPLEWGGEPGLAAFRGRLNALGLGLVLDFVPNHLGRDHPWLARYPDRFVQGTEEDLVQDPENWFAVDARGARKVFGHGRDPYFPGWTDTVQLDYRKPATREAMIVLLERLAGLCDGVRCDVAMLLLSEIFAKTWGGDPCEREFWRDAIARVRATDPDFVLIAEVYWGLGTRLHSLGFDYAYDKDLYDRLVEADVAGVRAHLSGDGGDHSHQVHFLENHDEPRARATFGDKLRAAATVTYSLPGLRFFFEGQREGRSIRTPVQLARSPEEPRVPAAEEFYDRLFATLTRDVFHRGAWSLPSITAEGDGEDSSIVGACWSLESETWLILANLAPTASRARVGIALTPNARASRFVDAMTGDTLEAASAALDSPELVVELDPWGVYWLRAET